MKDFLFWFSRTAFGKWWCEGNIHPDYVADRFGDLVIVAVVVVFVLVVCFSKKVRNAFFPK